MPPAEAAAGATAGGVWKVLPGRSRWSPLRAARPAPVFAVRVVGGEPHAVAGRVTAAFLQRVREVAAEHRVTTGRVSGVARAGGRIALTFSGHFPAPARQQLRNWWVASGWSAPKRRP